MKLVVDANVVISALIADSKTRELIVTLEPDLLTPEFVHYKIENYTDLIVDKSDMNPKRVAQFITSCFSISRSSLPASSIPTLRSPARRSVRLISTTYCTSHVSSPVTRTSGATTLTLMSKGLVETHSTTHVIGSFLL